MAFVDTDTAAGGPLVYFHATEGTATPDLDDATKTLDWTTAGYTNLPIIGDTTPHFVEVSEDI